MNNYIKQSGFILLMFFTLSCDMVKNPSRVVDISGEYACMSLTGYFSELNRVVQAGETIPGELEKLNCYGQG
jgi:hypothetical protein